MNSDHTKQNNPEPLVSIIIPSYNREKLIVKALSSIYNQTYRNFEILIVDDASTDNTGQVIKNLGKSEIHYIRLDKNGGQCVARNHGIRKANGKYIAFLDSDDEWLPDKLKLQVDCFENGPENLGCVYGYSYLKDAIKNETSLNDTGYHRGDIYDKFLEGFCPPTPSLFMLKKEALQLVNGFDEKLITFVDLDLWLRISQHYLFDYIEQPIIVKYEYIGDQYINNFEKRYRGLSIFLKKWQDEIIKNKGKKGLLNIRKTLVNALIAPVLQHPPDNLRRNIFKLLGLLISIRSKRMNFYIKAILILFFGPNVIYFIRERMPGNKNK